MLRPGRSVSLRQAEIADAAGRVVARAQAWTFPVAAGGAGADGSGRPSGSGRPGGPPGPLAHGPLAGRHEEPPSSWSRGYLDAIEWRWIDIERAATLEGKTVSGFILSSALASAEKIINEHESIQLNEQDAQRFFDALAKPVTFNKKLTEALAEHYRRVNSK